MKLIAPISTDWSVQPVRLWLPGTKPGEALGLQIDGTDAAYQYTGHADHRGAEVFVLLGFEKGQTKELVFGPAMSQTSDLQTQEISFDEGATIGPAAISVRLAAPRASGDGRSVAAPLAGVGRWPMDGTISCETPLEHASLHRTCAGPLFEDYRLQYAFAGNRQYTVSLRLWRHDTMVEVSERYALGMNGRIVWTLNPQRQFDTIVSRESFENEAQPEVERIDKERVRDVLCRLQMPVLTEYFIPNNRGWFSFFDSRNSQNGMLTVLGLYGDRWQEPVDGIPELLVRGGTVEWHATLTSGSRHYLLHVAPVQTTYSPDHRLPAHRLHAEFNALRLDEHLDLGGHTIFDASSAAKPGMFDDPDLAAAVRRRASGIPALARAIDDALRKKESDRHPGSKTLLAMVDPTPDNLKAIHRDLVARFEKWVSQFQGYRTGENDYAKNVIGFSRRLRGMLIQYELLRRCRVLDDAQIAQLNAYFVFAARRISDEGRWPHSRTTLHPDHPESTRDLYTYGGEHKPDRLYWTNSLPNFQGDPLIALAHISALFQDHPDSGAWLQKALDDLNGQLDAYAGRSGAWEESINYALYTFSYWIITFRVLKKRLGIDYFNDTRVRKIASWLVRFFGPYDKRFNAHTWPGVGNAVVPQIQAEYLLAYASELAEDDSLRHQCIAVYQLVADRIELGEHYPAVIGAMGFVPDRNYTPDPVPSEWMDEVGVAMRHQSRTPAESYLFQKIGFAKDHYEGDESSFNWYAKGTPFCMDYGTYTGDVGVAGAHNLVEIPDEDPLRRGYLKSHLFTPLLDYTHCQLPVTLKLLWGKVRSFEEVENKDGKIDRTKTPYFYIGDKNPVGPKTWKVRLLMFVKPDYLVTFDRVYGRVPHRYNLHVTGTDIQRNGPLITAKGRFDLDLLAYVHHPAEFDMETGELIPNFNPPGKPNERLNHAQHFFRLYNRQDGIYRTVLFAKERGRDVRIESIGESGMKVVTPEYTDIIFIHNDVIHERIEPTPIPGQNFDQKPIKFVGRVGWVRLSRDGSIQAAVIDGSHIEAFGRRFAGQGPWVYGIGSTRSAELLGGPPRSVTIV